MAKEKIRIPTSMGGLVRYSDEYKSRLAIKPGHVIILSVIVIIAMIVLHYSIVAP